jgi:hypothetical protein
MIPKPCRHHRKIRRRPAQPRSLRQHVPQQLAQPQNQMRFPHGLTSAGALSFCVILAPSRTTLIAVEKAYTRRQPIIFLRVLRSLLCQIRRQRRRAWGGAADAQINRLPSRKMCRSRRWRLSVKCVHRDTQNSSRFGHRGQIFRVSWRRTAVSSLFPFLR